MLALAWCSRAKPTTYTRGCESACRTCALVKQSCGGSATSKVNRTKVEMGKPPASTYTCLSPSVHFTSVLHSVTRRLCWASPGPERHRMWRRHQWRSRSVATGPLAARTDEGETPLRLVQPESLSVRSRQIPSVGRTRSRNEGEEGALRAWRPGVECAADRLVDERSESEGPRATPCTFVHM